MKLYPQELQKWKLWISFVCVGVRKDCRRGMADDGYCGGLPVCLCFFTFITSVVILSMLCLHYTVSTVL
jgi:hypothetical protein